MQGGWENDETVEEAAAREAIEEAGVRGDLVVSRCFYGLFDTTVVPCVFVCVCALPSSSIHKWHTFLFIYGLSPFYGKIRARETLWRIRSIVYLLRTI